MALSDPPFCEFAVGVVLHNIAGGGHLLVGPEVLEIHPGPLSRRASRVESVRHMGTEVETYRARLLPPWVNCSVVVSDGSTTVLATFPTWMRKRICRALRQAGFQTTERMTLTERGWDRLT